MCVFKNVEGKKISGTNILEEFTSDEIYYLKYVFIISMDAEKKFST